MNNPGSGRLASRIDSGMLFHDELRNNPLVVNAAGAALIAGGCIDMTGALILSAMMMCILPLIGIGSAVEMERLPAYLRRILYSSAAAVVVLLLSLLFDRIFSDSVTRLGIFVPLVAVDSLVLARTSEDMPYYSWQEGVALGCAWALSFAAIALPVALLREVIGAGSFFGIKLGFGGLASLRLPFAGFILCGAAIACCRALFGTDRKGRH